MNKKHALVGHVNPSMCKALADAIGNYSFFMKPDQVRDIEAKLHMKREDIMISLLSLSQQRALAPISQYRVAAVAETLNSELLIGVNIESSGVPLNETIHAEQSIIALGYNKQIAGLRRLAVSAPPCGHCRQLLNDTMGARELEILIPGRAATTLADLLPDDFSFRDFVEPPLQIFAPIAKSTLRPGHVHWHTPLSPTFIAKSEQLIEAALAAAELSFAPSTKYAGGVGILMRDGSILKGSYIESSAYNPSIPALQCALICAVASGQSLHDIAAAILAEKTMNAQPSYRQTAGQVLRSWAPSASFGILEAFT